MYNYRWYPGVYVFTGLRIHLDMLEEDVLTSQEPCFETTDISATPSCFVHCEKIKALS